jgi:hypothetical protein
VSRGSILEKLLAPGRREAKRIATLRAAGQTIDLDQLTPDARVVDIDIGFGREAWLAPPGAVSITDGRAIAGGALILAAGKRAGPRSLRERGLTAERIVTRLS